MYHFEKNRRTVGLGVILVFFFIGFSFLVLAFPSTGGGGGINPSQPKECADQGATGTGVGAGATCQAAKDIAEEAARNSCIADAASKNCTPIAICQTKSTEESVGNMVVEWGTEDCGEEGGVYSISANTTCTKYCEPKPKE